MRELSDEPTTPHAPEHTATAGGAVDAVAPDAALTAIDDARSPDPSVCPFLRLADKGQIVAPLGEPDDGHRCVAIGAPSPQSLRQQELVCLRSAHVDCPRYLRGAVTAPGGPRRRRPVPRATVAALLILVLSAGISFGFVVQRGGIDLPAGAGPGATSMAAITSGDPTTPPSAPASPVASAPASDAAPTAEPTPSPTVAPTPSPTPTPDPTPSPTPEATPTPTPAPTTAPTAAPTSDRYQVLVACPNRKSCYIYTVRAGDNLYSIAHWFGIPLSTIYDWNPTYANGGRLRAGDQIKMPPPTR